nr:leucine-responsive transcriptional regulator Lrp [Terasakiispira papahanaumokuakeensis]
MPMKNSKPRSLDRIDLKILQGLQENARISYVDLANQVGLSTTPCLERVKRLERNGVIKGYKAILNPKYLRANLLVFVEISLETQSPSVFDEFRRAVAKLPQIQECHLVSGQFDYILKCRIPEMSAYRQLLGDVVLTLPGVKESKSYVVMEEVKEDSAIYVPELAEFEDHRLT